MEKNPDVIELLRYNYGPDWKRRYIPELPTRPNLIPELTNRAAKVDTIIHTAVATLLVLFAMLAVLAALGEVG